MGWFDSIIDVGSDIIGGATDFLGSDVGQSVLGVGGNLLNALIQSGNYEDAADLQAKILQQGVQASEEAIAQGRTDVLETYTPGLEDMFTGFQAALGELEGIGPAERAALDLSGAGGVEAEQAAIDAYMESPAQKFLREQGEQTLLRNAAATGGLGGDNLKKELIDFGIGTAAQNMQQRFQNLASLINPETTRSTNIANTLAGSGTNLANYRANLGGALSRLALGGLPTQAALLPGISEAKAAGQIGPGQIWSESLSGLSKTLGEIYGK